MILDPKDYSDEDITFFTLKHIGKLLSVALPLAHVQEAELPPAPEGLSDRQRELWRIMQLAEYKDTDDFSRGQLVEFLVDLREGVRDD